MPSKHDTSDEPRYVTNKQLYDELSKLRDRITYVTVAVGVIAGSRLLEVAIPASHAADPAALVRLIFG